MTAMTNLPEVAKCVAEALGLSRVGGGWHDEQEGLPYLADDGYNLFTPYWFQRCLLWLLEQGSFDYWTSAGVRWVPYPSKETIELSCPAEEVPARIVAAIVRGKNANG